MIRRIIVLHAGVEERGKVSERAKQRENNESKEEGHDNKEGERFCECGSEGERAHV